MRYFITYGDDKFKVSRERICTQATDMNVFNSVKYFTPDDIDVSFKEKLGKYWNETRGGGLWLWKPYIIYKTLEKLNDGDFLVYCDSGCHFDLRGRQTLLDYFKLLEDKALIQIVHPYKEKEWTIGEIYDYYEVKRDESLQIWAGCQIVKKCSNSMMFYAEYFNIAGLRPDLFSLDYNVSNKNAFPSFNYNRHDQSIFSIFGKLQKYKDFIVVLDHYNNKFPRQVSIPPFYPILAARHRQ
jgi:hypothetical protein